MNGSVLNNTSHVFNGTVIVQLNGSALNNSNQVSNGTVIVQLNEEFRIFVEIICVLVFLLGLVGNSLVIFVFSTRWTKLKNCEMFMLSLAVADLVGTIIMPVKMFLDLIGHDFYMIGDVGCKIISSLSVTTITVSSLTLLVISIDRYIIVKWPLRKTPERWKTAMLVLATWLISFALSFIFFLDGRIRLWDNPEDDISSFVCRNFMSRKEEKTYIILMVVVQIVIPLTVMTILYVLITILLRQTAKSDLFRHQEREMRARLRRNRKATILFVTLVTTYYVFVLPSNIFILLYTFGETGSLDYKQLLTTYTLMHMVLMLNSCVNPIIYSNLHTSFRRSTLKLLCSCVFTKFKTYQWGDNVRSILRSSTRSVRGSLQSSRDLLFNRRKSADDENHNSYSAARKIQKGSSDLLQESVQLSTLDHFEEFDHYASRKRTLTFQIDDDDDVFELNNGSYNVSRNSLPRRGLTRNSTCTTTIDSTPPDTPGLSPILKNKRDANSSKTTDKRKIMQALKKQQKVEEEEEREEGEE